MEGMVKNLQEKPRNVHAVRILAASPSDPAPLIFCESRVKKKNPKISQSFLKKQVELSITPTVVVFCLLSASSLDWNEWMNHVLIPHLIIPPILVD